MLHQCLIKVLCFLCVPALVSSAAAGASVCASKDCHGNQIESNEEQEGAFVKLEMLQRQKARNAVDDSEKEGTGEGDGDVVVESEGNGEEDREQESLLQRQKARTAVNDSETLIAREKEGTGEGVGDVVTVTSKGNGEEDLEESLLQHNAGSSKEATKKEGDGASLVGKDHNGKMCMLCNKPFAERVDREYKEFRTDCGALSTPKGPDASFLSVPVASLHNVGDDGVVRNGFCQLNFAKSCVDAVANKDYLYWAKSVNMLMGAAENAAWDARYCRLNGFLENNLVALQHDFQATQAKAADLCKTKYAKYNLENITFKDMVSAARYDDKTAPLPQEAELLAAWNCAMGDLGCDMALCAYSFCKKGSGTGVYDECEGWHPVHGMPVPKGI